MTHQEGNKLIAEFLGFRYIKDGNLMFNEATQEIIPISELKFHSDWNILIPVVEKIENLDADRGVYLVKIEGWACSISLCDETEWLICESDLTTSKIDSVYQCIVKFIQNHV